MNDIGGLKSRSTSTHDLVRRLLKDHVAPYRWRIAFALLLGAVAAGATAGFAKLVQPLLDEIFTARNSDMLLPIAGLVFVVFLARGLAVFGQTVLMVSVNQALVVDIQRTMFERLMQADLAFLIGTSPGKLIQRFGSDVNNMRTAMTAVVTNLGKNLLTLISLTVLMFYQDWLLATVAFFAFPMAVLPIVRTGKRLRKLTHQSQARSAELLTFLSEVLHGARHVKAYCMEAYETARATNTIRLVRDLTQKSANRQAILTPIMDMLGGLAIVSVILYGGYEVINGDRTAGTFFSFITALLLAYEPMKKLANFNAELQRGLSATERVFQIFDMKPAITDKPNAVPLKIEAGRIELEEVEFSYGPEAPALRNVTIDIPANSTVALVGPSGAGKSTILNVIPRFYEINAGAVRIDGQDVRDVTLRSLRQSMALVSQDVLLFDTTVGDNIAYGSPDASREAIEAAARAAGAHEFVAKLPDGYDTLVGPRGVRLSGGQRQRIAIARAMLKDAPILLLDEATSSLDTQSERHIQAALQSLMVGRTTIVIAHRLSTVVHADIIYVMDQGRVVERGGHAELIAAGGLYAKLYAMQFAGQEDDDVALQADLNDNVSDKPRAISR